MVALISGLGASLHAQPTRNGALPGPLPLFPADNWWNLDVSAAPVDPGSSAFITFIGTDRGMHPDLGGDSGQSDPLIYGIPYIVVDGSQPLEPVDFLYAAESDHAAPGRPSGYPIPVEARDGLRWIEGGRPGGDLEAGGDRHMLIVDRDHRLLFELFDVDWNANAARWTAGSGAIFPLDSNLRRPEGWTSADAAGLAILPGLIRYEEVYGDEPIRHAFRVTVRRTNGHVFPASHTAGSTAGALPMGARLRLRDSVDLSRFPPPIRKIFEAMKTYGLIVADNGSDLFVTGTHDPRWDNDLLNPAFRSVRASDFEVIELGWNPGTPAECTRPSISHQPAGGEIVRGGSLTLTVVAAGTLPLSYRWYAGDPGAIDAPVAGGTTATLLVTPTASTSYWVRVSNACGHIDSDAATVTIRDPRRRSVRRP